MEITDDQKKLLDNLYYKLDEPSAYRGVNTLFSIAKSRDSTIQLDQVKQFLK